MSYISIVQIIRKEFAFICGLCLYSPKNSTFVGDLYALELFQICI